MIGAVARALLFSLSPPRSSGGLVPDVRELELRPLGVTLRFEDVSISQLCQILNDTRQNIFALFRGFFAADPFRTTVL